MELPYIVNCIRQYVQVAPMPTTSHLRSTKCPAYLFIVCWNLSHHISNDSDAQQYHPSRFTKVVSKSKSSNESAYLTVLLLNLILPFLPSKQRTRLRLRDLMLKTLCFYFDIIMFLYVSGQQLVPSTLIISALSSCSQSRRALFCSSKVKFQWSFLPLII